VKRRTIVIGFGLAILVTSRAMAQNAPAGPDEQQLRYQLQTFEVVLQAAVRHGGDAFARQQAQSIPPGVQLTANDPQVRGFVVSPEGGGFLFTVVVPSIRPTISQLLIEGEPPRRQDPFRPAAGSGPGGGRVGDAGVQGLAAPDPMTASPVIDDGKCASRVRPSGGIPTRDYEYAVSVCDALMEAILDNSGALPIKESEWLTVAAVNEEPDPPSFVNSSAGYTTYLMIKGSDLLAYRQGRVSRDDTRKAVTMKLR
jgi:hypothetical protein